MKDMNSWRQQNTPPSRATIIEATAAAKLIESPHPPLLIDARHASLHDFERLRTAIPPPTTCTLPTRHFHAALVYDSGATTLQPPYSRAVLELHRLTAIVPAHVSLQLIRGGLCAMRAVAPHLVISPPTGVLPAHLRKFPWAVRAFRDARLAAAPPARVLPSLYVGAAVHASDPVWLRRHDVTHVLAVGEEFSTPSSSQCSFEWLRIPVRDHPGEPLSAHFPNAIAFLDEARAQRGVTLVHCLAGASRSVATVVAYLVFHGWGIDDALDHVKTLRPAANPNTGFMQQLHHWASVCHDNWIPNSSDSDDDFFGPMVPS